MMADTRTQGGGADPCEEGAFSISVVLTGGDKLCRRLAPVFSGGVGVAAVAGCTLRSLLTDQLGIEADYVEERLQTVFLNGHPVDDIDAARAGAGDVVALSAAMPGLVGATMRRGGRYAVLRQDISLAAEVDCPLDAKPFCLILKLFNLIAAELAPAVLNRGVWLDGDRLADHIDLMGGVLLAEIQSVAVDGNPSSAAGLAPALRGARVRLRLQPA